MKVNNFALIKSKLEFNSEGDFYLLQILKRRKDNPGMDRDVMRVKNYYINTLSYFEAIQEEVMYLCESLNARAYINIFASNYTKVALNTIAKITEHLISGTPSLGNCAWDSACCNTSDKIFLVDVDTKDVDVLNRLIDNINSCQSGYSPVVQYQLPTPSGYHLITHRFNKTELPNIDKEFYEIKSKCPTLLYF